MSDIEDPKLDVHNDIVYVNRQYSKDAGFTWQDYQLPDSLRLDKLVVDKATGNLIVATNKGLYTSVDFGHTWTVHGEEGEWLVWSFRNGESYATRTSGDLLTLKSQDGGLTWQFFRLFELLDMVEGPDSTVYQILKTNNISELYSIRKNTTFPSIINLHSCNAKQFIGITNENEILLLKDGVIKPAFNSINCESVLDEQSYFFGDSTPNIQGHLVTEDGVLILDTGRGELIRSRDGGQTIEFLTPTGMAGTAVNQILIDPITDEVWASTQKHGLFTSNNNLEDWQYSSFAGQTVSAVTAGHNPNEYWVSTLEEGLHFSENLDNPWQFFESDNTRQVATDALYDAGRYYFQSQYNVYHIGSQGTSLTAISTPANAFLLPAIIAITFDANGILYGLIQHDQYNRISGIFKLSDLATGWVMQNDNFVHRVSGDNTLFFDSIGQFWASDDSTLHRSLDEGKTWNHSLSAPGFIHDLIETPDGALWLAHDKGILRSVDGGQTWDEEMTGLNHRSVLSLAWNTNTGQILAGTNGGGVYRSQIASPVSITDWQTSSKSLIQSVDHFPNPVKSTSTIQFTLDQTTHLKIKLFDQLGREVRQITDRTYHAGRHQLSTSFASLASGVYFYNIQTPDQVLTRPIVNVE